MDDFDQLNVTTGGGAQIGGNASAGHDVAGRDIIYNNFSSSGLSKGLAKNFLQEGYDRSEIPQLILTSRKAFLWGFAFTATIPMLRDHLEVGLQNDLQIRFLLIKPGSEAAKMAIFGSMTQDADEFNEAVERNLLRLCRMMERIPAGRLEVRVIDYLPPFTVIAVDPHLPNGRMFVRLASFRMDRAKVPWFELNAKDDAKWFSVFVSQFESIWNQASLVTRLNRTELSFGSTK